MIINKAKKPPDGNLEAFLFPAKSVVYQRLPRSLE
jgi:hypothetical protein